MVSGAGGEDEVVGILWAELSWVDRSDPCWWLDEDGTGAVADLEEMWRRNRRERRGTADVWAQWPDKWGVAEDLEPWERSVLAVCSMVTGLSVIKVLAELLEILAATWEKSERSWLAFEGYGSGMAGAFKPVEPHPDRLVARGWSGFEVWGPWLQSWSRRTRSELWVWHPKQRLDWVRWPQALREKRVIVMGDERVRGGEVRQWWGVVDQGVLYAASGALLDVGLVDVLVPSKDVGLVAGGGRGGFW